jgi:hypothetical protein
LPVRSGSSGAGTPLVPSDSTVSVNTSA